MTVYENGIFHQTGERYAVAGDNITALFEDREGAFYIGDWAGRVRRIKDHQTVTFSQEAGHFGEAKVWAVDEFFNPHAPLVKNI